MRERERKRERERERERECVCVCMCVCERENVCLYINVYGRNIRCTDCYECVYIHDTYICGVAVFCYASVAFTTKSQKIEL